MSHLMILVNVHCFVSRKRNEKCLCKYIGLRSGLLFCSSMQDIIFHGAGCNIAAKQPEWRLMHMCVFCSSIIDILLPSLFLYILGKRLWIIHLHAKLLHAPKLPLFHIMSKDGGKKLRYLDLVLLGM